MDYKEYIKSNLLTKNGNLNTAVIRRSWFKTSDFLLSLKEKTTFLPEPRDIGEQLFCIFHNIQNLQLCPHCNKPLKFLMFKKGYSPTCNSGKCKRFLNKNWKSCALTRSNKYKNILDIFLLKYRENTFCHKDYSTLIKEKTDRIILSECGSSLHFVEYCDLENYSDELCNILKNTIHILPLVQNIKNLNQFKWGERFYLLKYQFKTLPLCVICNKSVKYIGIKHGYQPVCGNPICTSIISGKARALSHFNEIKPFIENQGFTILTQLSSYTSLNNEDILLKCNKCGKIEDKPLLNARWKDIYCSGCYGEASVSKEEKSVLKFIQSIYPSNEIQENIKMFNSNTKSVDILIPSKKLAIEYNGIFFHSFGKKNSLVGDNTAQEKMHKSRHLIKTQLCNELNTQLLQIFSNEWYNKQKQEVWKSIIKNKLNLSNKIYARKCVIVENISNIDKELFLQQNHLQGNDYSLTEIGLKYNDELVMIMTFCKSRFNKKYDWELSRCCSKLNTTIIGGASKLLKHFENKFNPTSLITYADRRYSQGKLYVNLGFSFSHFSPPNYFYFKNNNIVRRYSAQKHKLSLLLKEQFDPKKTESDNMYNAGYRRIWDCGNYVFTKTYSENSPTLSTSILQSAELIQKSEETRTDSNNYLIIPEHFQKEVEKELPETSQSENK